MLGRTVLGREHRVGAPSQCQCLRQPCGGACRGGSASLCVGCQCSRGLGSGSQGRRGAGACGGSLHDDCRWGRSMCGARSPSSRGGCPAGIDGELGPGYARCSACGGRTSWLSWCQCQRSPGRGGRWPLSDSPVAPSGRAPPGSRQGPSFCERQARTKHVGAVSPGCRVNGWPCGAQGRLRSCRIWTEGRQLRLQPQPG